MLLNCHIDFAVLNSQVCEVDVFDHPRFCDEFSHLVTRTFSCKLNSLLQSHVDGINVSDNLKILLNCRIYDAVVNSFSFSLTTVWSRCFSSSQILWWILTSIEWTFSSNLNSLVRSFVDGINVLDDVNMLLNCHFFNPVVNSLILQNDKSVKKMFLLIPDSVMNSHI